MATATSTLSHGVSQTKGLTEEQRLQTQIEAICRAQHVGNPPRGEEMIHTLGCMRDVTLTDSEIRCTMWGVGRLPKGDRGDLVSALKSGEQDMGNRKIVAAKVELGEPPFALDAKSSLQAKIRIANELGQLPGLR